MNIDGIQSGVVIDHITPGKAMEIYRYLHLDRLDCPVAVIQNVNSSYMGNKDIIKIDHAAFDIDVDAVGYRDPGSTVNIIRDGKIVEKKHVELPKKLVNVIHCKNPRCITTVEPGIDHIFELARPEQRLYRCAYCETERT